MSGYRRDDPLRFGPSRRMRAEGAIDLQLQEATGYGSLGEIRAALEACGGPPDFVQAFARISTMGVPLPDDPELVGLEYMRKVGGALLNQYHELKSLRVEAIGVLSEWTSMQTAFRRLLADVESEARRTEEYRSLPNAEARQAYIRMSVKDYLDLDQDIAIAVQRCDAFIEACRMKGKELDLADSVLDKQVYILRLQVRLGKFNDDDIA